MADDDLPVFLRARLGEDEQVAQDAVRSLRCGCHPGSFAGAWTSDDDRVLISAEVGHGVAAASGYGGLEPEVAAHIACWDPARVLAEVEAKRRVIDEWAVEAYEHRAALGTALRVLTLPYAGHPDYQQEWKP